MGISYKQTVLLLASLALSLSCSSYKKEYEKQVSGEQCTEAFETLASNDPRFSLLGNIQKGSGHAASYSFAGAGYTVEFLWNTMGYVSGFVVLCGVPLVAVAMAGGANANKLCLPGKIPFFKSPELGKKGYVKTKPLRCPDIKFLSSAFQKVADCFEKQETPAGKLSALRSLRAIKSSKGLYSCLPRGEQRTIDNRLALLRLPDKSPNQD